MNQAEWLASENPVALLRFVAGASETTKPLPCATPRKLRLYALTCWRHLWSERRADRTLAEAVEDWLEGRGVRPDVPQYWVNQPSASEAANDAAQGMWPNDARRGAALLREIVGDPFTPVIRISADCEAEHSALLDRARAVGADGRPMLVWREGWVTPAVLSVAGAIYEGRSFDELPVLADALEEAGCGDEGVLRHLRGEELAPMAHMPHLGWWRPLSGPHVRGCWALDLALGKN